MDVDRTVCPDCGFEVDQRSDSCPLCDTENATTDDRSRRWIRAIFTGL